MAKKSIVVLLVGLALVSVHLAEAQQPKKVPRIGYLQAPPPSAVAARTEAFRQGLRELGYAEGKNIIIEYRYGESPNVSQRWRRS
jgi:putative ABC transport system substrate-binding protein